MLETRYIAATSRNFAEYKPCLPFAISRSYVFASFQNVALKLGKFTNFVVLFSLVLMNFCYVVYISHPKLKKKLWKCLFVVDIGWFRGL